MKPLAFIMLFACGAAIAHDLTLRDGTVLREIKLREKTDKGIRVLHKDGSAFVDYSRIPHPDLYTWGFDQTKYEQTSAAITAAPVVPANDFRPARLYQSVSPTPSPTIPATPTASSSGDSSGVRGQCAATTKKGYRCSRLAQAGRSFCYQH